MTKTLKTSFYAKSKHFLHPLTWFQDLESKNTVLRTKKPYPIGTQRIQRDRGTEEMVVINKILSRSLLIVSIAYKSENN